MFFMYIFFFCSRPTCSYLTRKRFKIDLSEPSRMHYQNVIYNSRYFIHYLHAMNIYGFQVFHVNESLCVVLPNNCFRKTNFSHYL